MNVTAEVPALLALDAGIRETGWAVFKNGEVIENGVTGLSTRRKVEPEVRISHLIRSLNVLASQWQPQIVTLCQPAASTGRFRRWTCSCLRWLNAQRSAGFPSSPTPA